MVGWVQLDNQTQDPVAPVVVAPTTVENPQATLQMSFIRNNAKSHSRLNHFEVIAHRRRCCRSFSSSHAAVDVVAVVTIVRCDVLACLVEHCFLRGVCFCLCLSPRHGVHSLFRY